MIITRTPFQGVENIGPGEPCEREGGSWLSAPDLTAFLFFPLHSVYCVMLPRAGRAVAESKVPSYSSSPMVAFSLQAPEKREAHTEWQLCGSPISYRLDPGQYVFSVQAVDSFSNAGSSKVEQLDGPPLLTLSGKLLSPEFLAILLK